MTTQDKTQPGGEILLYQTEDGRTRTGVRHSRKRESRIDSAMRQPAVYILASKKPGTIYIGVTSDLVKRVWEHKQDLVEGFTRKYQVHNLVYFEQHEGMNEAIQREKQLKKWNRAWKIELIEKTNAAWRDLWPDIS